jgi:protein-disulfide isomerase
MLAWIAGPLRWLTAIVGAIALFLPLAPVNADDAMDEARVEAILIKLLKEKPDLVIDAIRTYQAREEQAKQTAQREQLATQKDALFNNPNDPFIGDPNAKITVVEFFDYRCGYCKRALQTVVDLVERNKDVRVVFKEFPILGEASMTATRVSLAVQQVAPQHYGEFHRKAMLFRGTITEKALIGIAEGVGISRAALENAIKDPAIQKTIRENYKLAEALNIRGTPAFVIGEQVIPGAVGIEQLESIIAELRG